MMNNCKFDFLSGLWNNVLCNIMNFVCSDLRANRLQSITAQSFSSPFENLPKLQVL